MSLRRSRAKPKPVDGAKLRLISPPPQPQFLTVTEAARKAGVTSQTVRNAIRNGQLIPDVLSQTRGISSVISEAYFRAWMESYRCQKCQRAAIRDGMCGAHAGRVRDKRVRVFIGGVQVTDPQIRSAVLRGCADYRWFLLAASGCELVARPVLGRPRLGPWEVAFCEVRQMPDGSWQVAEPPIGPTHHSQASVVTNFVARMMEARPC